MFHTSSDSHKLICDIPFMTKSNFIRRHYFVAGSLAALALLVVSAISGQLVITSFHTNGNLTWTNSVSNAAYSVQWASTVTGPWTNFQALTKLDYVQSTGATVTVKVPMFYRVATTEPADQNPEGIYLYRGFDAEGGLLNVGWLSLVRKTAVFTNGCKDNWSMGYAGSQPSADFRQKFGIQFGE